MADVDRTSAPLLVAIGFVTLWASYKLLRSKFSRYTYPPGPPKYPLIGCLPTIAKYEMLDDAFKDFQKQYGDIFTLHIGGYTTIGVCGYELNHEGLVKKGYQFADRPNYLFAADLMFQKSGVGWTNGEEWKELRSFAVKALREFGVGRPQMQERVQDEVGYLIKELDNLVGTPFDPQTLLLNAVSNIICGIAFGKRYDYSNPDFDRLMERLHYTFVHFGVKMAENYIPSLQYLPGRNAASDLKFNRDKVLEFVTEHFEEHRRTYVPGSPRDVIDHYLDVIHEGKRTSAMTEKNIFNLVAGLFYAGTDTTADTMQWFLLYMITHPEVLRKCHEEIDMVVGSGRSVTFEDSKDLHYFTAVIHEVQRIQPVAPQTLPHSTAEDVELGGYFFPKDTIVLFSTASVQMDENHWEEPEVFRPERWLDGEGHFTMNKAFMPWSAGPRMCLGKNLAKMELFVFLGNILQRFDFKLPDGAPTPSLRGFAYGSIVHPRPYELSITKRY